jgi:5-methylcytosine-specific restriction protein A
VRGEHLPLTPTLSPIKRERELIPRKFVTTQVRAKLSYYEPSMIMRGIPVSRNPNWTRDELILALDIFFRVKVPHFSENHPEVIALSNLLNALPIHQGEPANEKFRNSAGVYMKLCNFLRLDPTYDGTGLDAGSKLDEEIWNEFATDQQLLKTTAEAIRYNYQAVAQAEFALLNSGTDTYEEFPEGKILTRLHNGQTKKNSHNIGHGETTVCTQ